MQNFCGGPVLRVRLYNLLIYCIQRRRILGDSYLGCKTELSDNTYVGSWCHYNLAHDFKLMAWTLVSDRVIMNGNTNLTLVQPDV